ncbi:Gfo/Idh/MocA family protein [Protaetiibacter intestinalis]|uniref:Gfo/Idh/MocA family oxidoreductase n=1 Tax=Protaetiibacter intestinalis TaxID=2419774 RepID=A0A387BB33_9MICO|nr:Gfo/Idh/MocA family oxidoreductase [Protaetiibacter intestinalis]AYF98356.1 gfo/Idh/MocA family oxidoreductase [Protaetiibacter intestinalis]
MARPRLAVIGAGAMGSRHLRVIAQSNAADLVGVVEPNADLGQAVATTHGTRWFADLDDELLSTVQGVVVATPTETHEAIAEHILGAGIPLLVEKPIAPGLAQTEKLLALAEAQDLPLMCGFAERFNPGFLEARAIIDEPVHVIATRHSPYAPRIRTGVAWDLLVHDVDLVCLIFGGEPSHVRGFTGVHDPRSLPHAEDIAETTLVFPDREIAHVSASRISQRKVRSLWVHEVDRLIEIDLLRKNVTIHRSLDLEPADSDGRGYRQESVLEVPDIRQSAEPLVAQFGHFLDLIEGRADSAAERRSVLPAHRVVEQLLTQ